MTKVKITGEIVIEDSYKKRLKNLIQNNDNSNLHLGEAGDHLVIYSYTPLSDDTVILDDAWGLTIKKIKIEDWKTIYKDD